MVRNLSMRALHPAIGSKHVTLAAAGCTANLSLIGFSLHRCLLFDCFPPPPPRPHPPPPPPQCPPPPPLQLLISTSAATIFSRSCQRPLTQFQKSTKKSADRVRSPFHHRLCHHHHHHHLRPLAFRQ